MSLRLETQGIQRRSVLFGIFRRRKRAEFDSVLLAGTTHHDGSPSFDLAIVGESHYQDATRKVAGGTPHGKVRVFTQAGLIPEPGNPYDKHAITVVIDGRQVGHLSREDADAYQLLFRKLRKEGKIGACQAVIVGDKEKYFGVWLSLEEPGLALGEES